MELRSYNGKNETTVKTTMGAGTDDNSSQEYILEGGNGRGIVKTVETRVYRGEDSTAL